MKSKKTNAKRQPVSHTVQPFVGAEDRCFRLTAEIDLQGGCHGAWDDAWVRLEMHEDGETDLFISDHIMSEDEDHGIGGCYYAEGIPKRAMIILRDYLNAAFPLNSPNPTGHAPARSAAEGR
ncbi:MAG: hypothetical protein BWY57_03245 [Betaproteobacteria bacterium ADurb.Bin341]|nr:MAG: hypothetical protein BWY57_03245 [Betaproteobacteria bacterium ADurb.Bin341]